MTVQVKWKVPAWGTTFQLPQQTLIIRIASQVYLPSAQVSKFKSPYCYSGYTAISSAYLKTSHVPHMFKYNYLNEKLC